MLIASWRTGWTGTKALTDNEDAPAYVGDVIYGGKSPSGTGTGRCNAQCGCHGIAYNGGPQMGGTVKVHLIWYGHWKGRTTTASIIYVRTKDWGQLERQVKRLHCL